MKRRFLTVVVGMLVLAMLATVLSLAGVVLPGSSPSYAATAQVTNTKVSGITVQNQSETAEANVQIQFYDTTGALKATITAAIPANSSQTWYSPNITGLPEGFIGSAVVSSDQPVAAIVNTQTPSAVGTDPADPARVGTSSGVTTPGTTAYAPQVMANLSDGSGGTWSSTIYAQNTTASQISINVKILNSSGTQVYNQDHAVAAYSTKVLRQTDMGLGNGFIGSAALSSSANIAVTVNFYNAGTSAATAQFHSYNAFTSGATTLYVPRLVKNYGNPLVYYYNSGLKIQNIGSSAASVTVTYYLGSAQGVTQNATIQPNQAWGPYMGSEGGLPASLAGISAAGSAKITSNQPIVAIINEDNRTTGQGVTYNAFMASQATNTILLPQVTAKLSGYHSGVQFQNVSASAATGTLTFIKPGTANTTVNWSLASNQSFSYFVPSSGLTSFNGSAIISSNQPIVGIANLSYRNTSDLYPSAAPATKYGDTFTTYNGINK